MSDKQRVPPEAVAKAAAHGLELRQKFKRGGTSVGAGRAGDLKARKPVSDDIVRRMVSYFARHQVDKRGKNFGNEDDPSAGYIAWLLWGGDAGKSWCEAEKAKLQKAAKD